MASLSFGEKQLWFERKLDELHGATPSGARKARPLTLDVRRPHALVDSLRKFEGYNLERLRNAALRVRCRRGGGIPGTLVDARRCC